MLELIWVGNYLIPRGVVVLAAAVMVIAMVAAVVWFTRDRLC